jgi:hypothetical protein
VPILARERPDRMHRRGRAEDPVFSPNELLYRRYVQQHWIDGCFAPEGFRFSEGSGQSVNRQKYSEPEDVLFLDDGTYDDELGVLEFAVRGIPARLPEDGSSAAFEFFPKHVPEELNFAHSEVWCDKEERTGGYVVPNKVVRKLLRTKISQCVFIRILARK